MANTNTKASARKAGKATSKASKATKTTTTSKAAPAKMDAAAVLSAAALVLGKYKTISGIKTTASTLRAKYGPENWDAIMARAKALRQDQVTAAAKAARDAVFTYRPILAAAFKVLAKDHNFKALCNHAKAAYKGTDADAAAALVRDYYTAVDAAGAPLVLVKYISKGRTLIFTEYQRAALTDVAALAVLRSCLGNMASAARKAAKTAKDGARAAYDNQRTPDVVAAVYRAVKDGATGTYSTGAVLTGTKASKADADKNAVKAAAAYVGKARPDGAARLATINGDATAAYNKAARKALADQRAGLAKDATAAGLATKAPGAGHVVPRPAKTTKGAPLAGDAFIAATKAAAKADAAAVVLHG